MDLRHLDTKNKQILVGERYLLKDRLGGGSFGQIYGAVDKKTKTSVAVKLEQNIPNKNTTLSREAKVLSDLEDETGFPNFYGYGKEEKYSYLAMSLLGLNLEKLLKLCGNKFSLKTVLMLADQMISRIAILHKKNHLHRDIKPENFCLGTDENKHILYIIDFGLARSYKDVNGQHIPYREKKGLVGTARYASINTHLGIEQSRRDDLESIGYTLIYFLKGELPWQNLKAQDKQEKYRLIAEKKLNTSTEMLCRDLPEEFMLFLDYVKSLGFTDTPNYKYLKKLFNSLFVKNHYSYDYNYDWIGMLNENSPIGNSAYKRENLQLDSNVAVKVTEEPKTGQDLKKKIEFSPVAANKEASNPFFKSSKIVNPKSPANLDFSNKYCVNPGLREDYNLDVNNDNEHQEKFFMKTKTNAVAPKNNNRGITLEISYKNKSTNLGESSRERDFSETQEIAIASEFQPKASPSAKLEQMKCISFKNKDFSCDNRRFFTSLCHFDETGTKSRQFLTQRNYPTGSGTQLNEDLQAELFKKSQEKYKKYDDIFEIEEDMAETSICEWQEGNYLGAFLQNKEFNM